MSLTIQDNILDAVFRGACGDMANRRNSIQLRPFNSLATGCDHIAAAHTTSSNSAT